MCSFDNKSYLFNKEIVKKSSIVKTHKINAFMNIDFMRFLYKILSYLSLELTLFEISKTFVKLAVYFLMTSFVLAGNFNIKMSLPKNRSNSISNFLNGCGFAMVTGIKLDVFAISINSSTDRPFGSID